MKLFLIMILALLAFTANADSEIYKWVDKEGTVHYSESPPPSYADLEIINAKSGPKKEQIEEARQRLDAQLAEEEERRAVRQEKRLEQQRDQMEAAYLAVEKKRKQKSTCLRAQQNLYALNMKRPVYFIDEKGERVYLRDEMHKAEIERMGQLIRQNCVEK